MTLSGSPRLASEESRDAASREQIRQLEERVARLVEEAVERDRKAAAEVAAYQAAYTERVGYLEAQVAALTEAAIERETRVTGQIAAMTDAAIEREKQLQQQQEIDYQIRMIHQNLLAEFKDLEPEFVALHERCKAFTMTSLERLYSLHKCIEYITASGIAGDLAECGVWRGGSCMLMALTLVQAHDTSRCIYMYDTFEGHPQPDPQKDVDLWGNRGIDEWHRQQQTDSSSAWGAASLEEVRENLLGTGYPEARLFFIKGMVESTVPENIPERLALLRLDSDWYESTRFALRYLYPRLVDGGVLIIDDYGHYRGQRQAVDEYFAEIGEKPLLHRIDYSCRVMVKRSKECGISTSSASDSCGNTR